ncbi:MAG TPA: hypothetical protein VHA75_01355 [Rugosimonospora sp.]|nr:hypothetical protein [Rugosimonospora sp.]
MISRRRIGVLALLAGTVAAVVTACAGGSPGSGTPAPSASGVQAELEAYVNCLNQNGVKVTLPSGGTGTRPSGRPSGFGSGRAFPSGRPSDFPRPSGSFSPGTGGFGGRGGASGLLQKPADVDQATWDKAVSACESVRPSFGAGGGSFGRGNGNGADAAYLNCLRDHGVTGDASPSTEALQACAVLKPTASPS